MRNCYKALSLKTIRTERHRVIFRIDHQAYDLQSVLVQKNGDSRLVVNRWVFKIDGGPELCPSDRVLFLRGRNRSLDHQLLSCPTNRWESLLSAVEEFNKIIGPIYTFEDHFFKGIPPVKLSS